MKNWRKKLEDLFTAIAFAEAGDDTTALKTAGLSRQPLKARFLENAFTAVALAEAGLQDAASEIVAPAATRKVQKAPSLADFIQEVGLQGIELRFGIARI
jgi:hypothetical protein